jgi:hypothetical protein
MARVQEDFPSTNFITVFLECPEDASSNLECARCEITFADEDTPNEIDLSNSMGPKPKMMISQ